MCAVSMPTMVAAAEWKALKPIIGPAPRHKGVWFALGHAHQGFTLGPATGQLLASMMEGEVPAIEMEPFSAERFL